MANKRRQSNESIDTRLAALEALSGKVAVLRDEKPNGTNSGTSTAGSYNTRILNTLEDPNGIVLNGSTFTGPGGSTTQFQLGAGKYKISASAAWGVGSGGGTADAKVRIQNISDSTTAINGMMTRQVTGSQTSLHAFLAGEFTITSTKTFELQMRVSVTQATTGFGYLNTFGDPEVFAILEIIKVG